MKSLVSNGSGGLTVIITTGNFRAPARSHDPWPTHAPETPLVTTAPTATFQWVNNVRWKYISGDYWNFPSAPFPTADDAQNNQDIWFYYIVFTYVGYATGLGYNFIERRNETLKLTDAGYGNYLATH